MFLTFGSTFQFLKFQTLLKNAYICEILKSVKKMDEPPRYKYRIKFTKDFSIPLVKVCVASFCDKPNIQISFAKYFTDYNKPSSLTSIAVLLLNTIRTGTLDPTES